MSEAQKNTQEYGSRPYGVGLLVIGYDTAGPHVFEVSPTGNNYEYFATSIGSRSQSARTFLERNFTDFPAASLEQLVTYGVKAIRDTLPQDLKLTQDNLTIAWVGKDTDFCIVDGTDTATWLEKLDNAMEE